MTQQEMVDILNHYTIDYNVTWDEVKYDADRAIMRINSHLGAKYPKMSEIMVSPEHHYSIRVKDKDVQIFPERYILTVVIPFIASEILARDEEFTTIYNKYVLDFENGLFDMFQNEFNKVPAVFRQDIDSGVFFAEGTPQRKVSMDVEKNLPKFVFDIHYHNTNPYIDLPEVLFDTYSYEYETTAKVLDMPESSKQIISKSGAFVYKFKGWSKDPRIVTELVPIGTEILMTEDLHLYTVWERESTLNLTNGVVTIKDEYKSVLTYLEIPDYINGKLVTTIPANFLEGADALKTVVLPTYLVRVSRYAFTNSNLANVVFPEYNGGNNIIIEPEAFNIESASNITNIYLPRSVSNIGAYAFTISPAITINCEVLEANKPEGWAENWEGYNTVNWGVYNG